MTDNRVPAGATHEERQRHTDNTHRAIGRFIAEFSGMVWAMRSAVEVRLTKPLDEDDVSAQRKIVGLLLGEASAQYVLEVFFAACRADWERSKDEKSIEASLYEEIKDLVKTRNTVAHGDWQIGDPGEGAWVSRTRPARKGEPQQFHDFPSEDLDALSDRMRRLAWILAVFGRIALGMPLMMMRREPGEFTRCEPGELRITDVLVVRDGKVYGEGPAAADVVAETGW